VHVERDRHRDQGPNQTDLGIYRLRWGVARAP
jgi:hypothetical protein